jgi:hypothetical protein
MSDPDIGYYAPTTTSSTEAAEIAEIAQTLREEAEEIKNSGRRPPGCSDLLKQLADRVEALS